MDFISDQGLSELEKVLLVAIARANNFSIHKHSSKETIRKDYPKELKEGKSTRILSRLESRGYKKLRSKRLIQKHPTKGGATWNITKDGIKRATELEEELSEI